MAFSHTGFLGDRMTGKALEIGVCATASAGFLLFGYGVLLHPIAVTLLSNQSHRSGSHVWYYH